MNFGSLSSEQQIMVLLALKGGPEYAAQMEAAAAETGLLGEALLATSKQMTVATQRSWLHNQALYTGRRYAFYATLAVTALAYEIGRLGFSYNSTIQSARVALRGMFDTRQEMDKTIKTLYNLSTFSPFLFKDTLTAFRTMAPAMKNAGIPVTQTLQTMKAIMDALSQSGHTSVGNLTRVSVQLQHLANIGRPTGQILLALARDGLPVYPALRKELGLTGTSLENLSASGLTAAQTINALNKFIETSPIYKGQAFKQATQTLQGNFQMFKDILAQASGNAEGGLFGGLTSRFKAINTYLRPLLIAGKPVGLYQIAQAIDHALTPNTHMLLNLFVTLDATLNAFIHTLGIVAKVVSFVLRPFDLLLNAFGFANTNAQILGGLIGMLAAAFFLAKIALMPFIIAIDLWKSAVVVAQAVSKGWLLLQFLMDANWSAAWALITGNTVAVGENTIANEVNTMSLREKYDAMIAANAIMGVGTVETEALTVATLESAGAMTLFGLSLDAMLGPIGLVIAGLALIIYYHKQIAKFTGLPSWNPLSHSFWHSSSTRNRRVSHSEMMAANAPRGHHWFDALNPTHWFATGGRMSSAGTAVVGENGPELLHLPGGAQVTPLNGRNFSGMGSLQIIVYPQDIYLDGKKIATVIAQATTDKQARMSGRNT
jgi:hypothetical protein